MPTLEPPSKIAAEIATSRLLDASKATIQFHANDPRWQLALRIASSSSMGRSRLLAKFLLFIVDRHIRDRVDEMTEQQIGMLVFARAEGYDSNEDNIVRSYARNLRRRIDDYYAKEGKHEALRLEIPRGGYVPSFTSRDTFPEEPSFESTQTETSPDKVPESTISSQHSEEPPIDHQVITNPRPVLSGWYNRFKIRLSVQIFSVFIALCVGMAIGFFTAGHRSLRFLKHVGDLSADSAFNDLWRQIFMSDRDTFVVPSDDGLVIMQRLTERPVPLASYISGTYRNSEKMPKDSGTAEILKLGARRYTSVVDLDFATHLAQLDAVVPSHMVVRYARDLRMDDLRTGNTILIGSVESNPWIQVFEPQMNFRQIINSDPRIPSGFVNTHPRPGERNLYGTPGQEHTFGLIAYLPNLTSSGHVLIVGGLNTAGTQAATNFLLTPSLMAPTLKRAKAANGHLRSFELLIGAANFSSNASAPQLVIERINSL